MSSAIKKIVSVLLVSVFFFTPVSSYAQTTNYQPSTQQEFIAYLMGVLAQLQAQLIAQQKLEMNSSQGTTIRKPQNPYYVIVTTLAPVSLGRTIATLRGEVDKGSSATLNVWVAYGTGSNLSYYKNSSIVTKAARQTVDVTLDGLRPNTTYNYRFVAEDEKGYRHYGEIRSFTTVDTAETQSFYGKPTAETEGAQNIKSTGATIEGFISMNNYVIGNAFMVYSTNRNDVKDADYYDSFNKIVTVSGGLSKRSANSKFTGRNTTKVNLSGLKRATRYYYRACVEFSDSNYKYKDDTSIRCGEVEDFVTLN